MLFLLGVIVRKIRFIMRNSILNAVVDPGVGPPSLHQLHNCSVCSIKTHTSITVQTQCIMIMQKNLTFLIQSIRLETPVEMMSYYLQSSPAASAGSW